MKVLVLGGTRFFGKKLVHLLEQEGHEVFVFSRGQAKVEFSDSVKRLTGDRTDVKSLRAAVDGLQFDAVVDQVCMTAHDAEIAVEVFKDKTPRYIVTSTLAVYGWGDLHPESDVVPANYIKQPAETPAQKYGEDKRAMECVFSQQKFFSVAMVRFPVVVSEDDYTHRLRDHVWNVLRQEPIYFPNLDARFMLVHADDAARSLLWLVTNEHQGPLNIATAETFTLRELMKKIENICGQKTVYSEEVSKGWVSPYGAYADWTMDVSLSEKLGFQCRSLGSFLDDLLIEFKKEYEKK